MSDPRNVCRQMLALLNAIKRYLSKCVHTVHSDRNDAKPVQVLNYCSGLRVVMYV